MSNHNTEIRHAISNYIPKLMSSELWDRHQTEIRALATESALHLRDAKSVLTALSKFTTWCDSHRSGMESVREHLDEATINAYIAGTVRDLDNRSAINELGRLRRVHRTIADIPGRELSERELSRCSPYSEEETTALLSVGDANLTKAVRLGIDFGLVPPESYDHDPGYSRPDWKDARTTATDVGISLDAHRLRATWAHRQANRPVSASRLVAEGLTHDEIDAIARAADPLSIEQIALAR